MELAVTDLSVSRGNHPILHDVSLRVCAGERVAIMGPSGCGKSTLLKVLASLWPATHGDVRLGGSPLVRNSPDERVAYLPQKTELILFRWKTAIDHVRWPRILRNLPSGRIPEQLLQAVGLEHKQDSYPATLSGGEQRRLAIAMVLAQQPELLLMDEAFSGLDLDLTYRLWGVMHEACVASARPTTVILVTHSFDDAAALAHRTLVLQRQDGHGSKFLSAIHPRSVFLAPELTDSAPLDVFRDKSFNDYRSYLTQTFFESLRNVR